MKIRKVVKRLLAVATGATMLGATAMGAMAADLSNYPDMFVVDGVYDGYFVVGEAAASVDNLAMTDIAASMKYSAPSDTSTVTVEGDAWKVGTSAKFLEMGNSNASQTSIISESFRDISTFIGDDELEALADGTWATNENDYEYQQFLFFDEILSKTNIVMYGEDDNDVTADFFYVKSGREIARYKLEFSSTAQSDVTDSTGTVSASGTYLDDFENTEITFFGKPYTVVLARRPDSTPEDSARLVLMAGAVTDTILEGETKSYTIGEVEYEVNLVFTDSDEAKFTVNGEGTNKLQAGETYVLSDKTEIGLSEVLYQAYAGGVHSAKFFLGAQKVELRDDDVTDLASTSTYNVKVASEDIDGTTVYIVGTDDNSTFTISTIEVNMTAEDDFYVPAGGKLSETIAATGEEDEVLFTENWDIEYKGLEEQETHDIGLKTSSSKRYELHLFDGDGNAVDIPIAYAESASTFSIGKESQIGAAARAGQKKLILTEDGYGTSPSNNWSIFKDDYFVVTAGTASDGSAKSYLLQYQGADRSTKTSPKIKFKNMGDSSQKEYSVSASGATPTICTIKLGGYSFTVTNSSPYTEDDFVINVALDGDGDYADTGLISFVDYYGSQWQINSNITNSSQGAYVYNETLHWLTWSQTTPNGDDYDNQLPTILNLTITATTGPELRATLEGPTLITPEGETEVSYGYTSMGSFLTFNEPSGDPDELTINYPKEQKLPQVYITSGATTSTVGGDTILTKVEVVDATKLDSEVADLTAQNLIVVGGPCVNTVAAELLDNPADCTEGFRQGVARIKLFENGENIAMLVAGYSGADTRLAGKVVAHRATELSGEEVEVEGTTYTDATISAPTVVEEVAVEETVEEETTG